MESEPILRVKNLKIGFPVDSGYSQVVDGVDFAIHEAEVVGVLGESGAGKSLIAEAILGLTKIPPARVEGEIWVRGKTSSRWTMPSSPKSGEKKLP